MIKAERLMRLLTLLRARRKVITARTLAEHLEVSERTVYRDIQSLVVSGVPVEGEAGVGYRLQPGASLPPLMFDREEMEALLLGARMVQGWADDELSRAAESVLEKIRSVLPDRMVHDQNLQKATLLVPDMHRKDKVRFAARLRKAIKGSTIVRLDYRDEGGEQSQREVHPLALLYWGSAWTLLAWCLLRDDHRLFRLDRIINLKELDRQFQSLPHQTLESYIRQYQPDFDGLAF
ncbi:helix-turn-helix transcriptional regulator [Gilvimarinus sp. F26214L]|uniref:helix-turn-helix transcriptional regulator n=1 Tax=Gilvimarinus sp. DZF01 TaxID=3461371 RepID=UPI0040454E98